jgi:hypothetical protein
VTRNHGNTLKSVRGGNRQKRRIHPANNLLAALLGFTAVQQPRMPRTRTRTRLVIGDMPSHRLHNQDPKRQFLCQLTHSNMIINTPEVIANIGISVKEVY